VSDQCDLGKITAKVTLPLQHMVTKQDHGEHGVKKFKKHTHTHTHAQFSAVCFVTSRESAKLKKELVYIPGKKGNKDSKWQRLDWKVSVFGELELIRS